MKSERGNIIVYLLVGVVLFGLLLGGLWWVKARVADKPSAPLGTTEQNKPTTETDVNQDGTPEQKPSEEATTETEATPGTGSGEPANPAPAPTTPANPNTPTTPVLPPESQTPRTGPSPNNVAASGPLENAFVTSVGLGALVYLGTSYVRSRRA